MDGQVPYSGSQQPGRATGYRKEVGETVPVNSSVLNGRVSAQTPKSHMHLLKFSKPNCDRVTVEFSVDMTEAWLKQQMGRVHKDILKVGEASRILLSNHR